MALSVFCGYWFQLPCGFEMNFKTERFVCSIWCEHKFSVGWWPPGKYCNMHFDTSLMFSPVRSSTITGVFTLAKIDKEAHLRISTFWINQGCICGWNGLIYSPRMGFILKGLLSVFKLMVLYLLSCGHFLSLPDINNFTFVFLKWYTRIIFPDTHNFNLVPSLGLE